MAEPTEDDFLAALEEQQALAEDVGPEGVPEQQVPQQVQAPVQEREEASAFTQWEDYRNDPRFSDLAPAQKQNLFDDWQKYATEYLAQNGELSTEEDVKYTEGIFTDIAKIDNLRKPTFTSPNYVEELVQQAQSGYGALEAGTAGYASALGMTDTTTASNVISQKYREQRDRYVNPDLKKFTEEQAGFFASAGKIITNPFDIATPLFMQSMGSSAPAVGAGIVAGVAGTAVGGPAVGIGAGLATGAVGSGVVEGVVNFNQMVLQEVQTRGLDPAKAEDVQAVLDDPKFVSDAAAYSAARGVVIGAAELATFGAGKYIAGAAKLTKASGLKKVATGALITGVETIGEGVGETGAQIVAPLVTGKPVQLQPGEIAAEMFVQAPGSVAIAGLQTAKALVSANAPASASEVTREAVQAAAEGKYEQVLGVQPQPVATGPQKFYDSLSIADKAGLLGMAPNAVLTMEQGTYSSLSTEEKAKVQAGFDTETKAQQGPTVEEAEATAREAFQPAPVAEVPAPTETPVAEVPVPAEAPAPVAETPAPVAEIPAPVQPLEGKPITEQETAPLEQVAPASAQAVAEEQAPIAETPALAAAPVTKKLSPTKGQVIDIGNLNLPQLTELRNNLIQQDPGEYQVDREAAQRIFGKYGIDITGISDAKILDISRKFAEARKMAKNEGEVEAIFKRLLGTPASTPTTPVTKKLSPTKKQVTALSKLGYLPADIEALDRVQTKNILSNKIPKVPIEKAQKETEAVVAPQVEPADGKVDQPVAPTATAPPAEAPIEERLTEAEKKLQAKVGEVVAEADKLGVDEESVKAWLGPTPSEGKILRARVVLRLLNLGLADVYNNIRKVAAKTRGKQGELTQEGGPKIKRVVFTTREEGAGLLSNPEDMNSLDVIYVNPDRLLSRLRADLTTDAADFFVKVLEEELLHLQHGWAAFDLFAGTVPEDQINPENFKNFFRKQSEEIENSLTIGQIQEVVGKYAGIDTAGKTKEQLIQEFAQVAGRRGRLAEEYLRTLIQRRMLGDITEDKVRGLTPNSVLRSLGMIKNWLGKFVGETIPKKYSNQTPVERYYTAVSDLIYGNAPAKIREARDEQGTAISGKQTLTASLDPMAIRKRFEQTTYQKELVKKINEDFGLGKPREARKGAIWAKTVGKLIGQFPTFKPDEVEAIVGEDIPDAVKFFDPSQGAVFTTYLYQRAFRSLLDARGKQRRTGIYESGRTDVAGSVERARFQPLSEQIKKVEKPKDVTAEATAEEIASELEGQESAAEEAANSIVSRDADEVVQKYAEVVGKQAEEEQSFEEMLGPKTISGELTAPGLSPSQAAARNDLSKVFDQLFSTFSEQEQDVFDFLFRSKEMENPPTRQGIMVKYNLGHSRQYDRIVESVREKVANTLAENNIFSAGQLSASIDPVTAGKIREVEDRSKEFLAGVPDTFVLAFGPGGVITRPYWVVRSKNQITQDNLKTVQVAFMDRPISDLAAIDERGNVSVRTLNFLGSSNINNIEELMGLTEDKVRLARNTAPSTWDEVKQLQGIVNEMFAVPESSYFRTIKQARNALALTREKDPEAKAYGADGLDIDETEDFSKEFFGGTLERNIRSLSELLIDSELVDEGAVIHFADGRIGKPTFIVPAGGSREMGEAGVYFPSAEKADQMVQTLQKVPAFKDSYSKEIVSNITGQKFWQVYWGNRDTAENVVAIKKNNYEGGMEAYGMAFGYRPELVKDFAYKDYKEVENINLEKAKKVLEGEIIDKLLKFAAGDLLSGSVDPMATQALKRSLLSVPEAISNLLKARTYFPYENKELLQKANDFVDANAGENDIFQAKIALDRASETEVSNPQRVITLGVIGKRLKDALYALDQQIKKGGNTPELSALRDKYSNDLYAILSAAQDILSASGQDLQAGRVFANLFTPEQMVNVYTKPIKDAQKKLLEANSEIQKLKALIQQLKNELATKAVGKVIIIQAPEPESKFYDFLGLFGDIEPTEQESFQEYLTRIGIDYPALMVALETSITASVDPTTNANPLPKDFRNLNAREAIKQLVALDKNFFSKLVNLRAKTGAVATTAEVARAQTNKSRKSRPLELQMIFDFFNTSESEKPSSEEPIEKDTLPVMVRLAKYASDAVTDRVLKSLGMDKKTTPKGLFDAMEKQVRKFVNAQFREETNPQKTAVEDTRTPEQKLMDLVERIGLAEQIFNQTKESLQARLNEDTRLRTAKVEGQMSDAERTALQAAVNKTFDAGKILTTAKEVRELVDFRAEARKHISQRGATVGSLGRLIKEKLPNLNDAQVKALADLITANYNRLVKDSGATQLKNILKQSIAKESKEPKKEIDQMLELLNLGAFNEEKFYNAIADRFGLPAWDEAVVADIRKRGEAVERLPQGSDQRTVAALQLQGFIAQKLKEQAKGYAKGMFWMSWVPCGRRECCLVSEHSRSTCCRRLAMLD